MSHNNQNQPLQDGIAYVSVLLEQAIRIVDVVVQKNHIKFSHHVGPHLRHIVEHFEALMLGLDSGLVSYDARKRRQDIENSPELMRDKLRDLDSRFQNKLWAEWPLALNVASDIGACGENGLICPSTPLREILFVTSHATHHYAILKVILEHEGVKLPADFGKAPSTVKFEKNSENAVLAA